MKKRSGVRRAVSVLPFTALEKMTTKQLLARLARLRHEDALERSDVAPADVADCSGILFKQDVQWRTAYTEVKRVLAQREHVPRPQKTLAEATARPNAPGQVRAATRKRRGGVI
jgi:hypothetical protein